MNLFLISHFFGVISFAFVLGTAMAAKYGMLKLCCSEYLIAAVFAVLPRTTVRHEGEDRWHSKIHRVCRRIVINWILSTLFRVIFISISHLASERSCSRTSRISRADFLGSKDATKSSRVNNGFVGFQLLELKIIRLQPPPQTRWRREMFALQSNRELKTKNSRKSF